MSTEPTDLPEDLNTADAQALEGMIKALRTDGKPPSLWLRFKWWFEGVVFARFPRPIRHGWWSLSRHWHEQVTCRLFPRQRWLTRSIPRVWQDKSGLLVDVLYTMVIHFVEEEECFEVTDWPGSGLTKQEAQLREVYAWAKTGRAAFQKRIDDAHPPLRDIKWKDIGNDLLEMINEKDEARDAAYREVWRLEAEMTALDTKHLRTICDIRETLWT